MLISLFPFHSWAAPAYASAPAPTAMLHAGVLKKFGLYGLLRVAVPMLPAGFHAEWIQHLLLVLLLGNILFIGLVTIAQKELDLTLGNSSVMHMGYVFLGIASGTAVGYSGAIFLMFAHGVSIALLFALCSHVREKTGTLQLARLGGLAKSAPFLGLSFAMAAFASIGLPGFANFAAELMVFLGGFAEKPADHLGPLQVTTILALWGVVISAVYMLRAFRKVFQGEPAESLHYGAPISPSLPASRAASAGRPARHRLLPGTAHAGHPPVRSSPRGAELTPLRHAFSSTFDHPLENAGLLSGSCGRDPRPRPAHAGGVCHRR